MSIEHDMVASPRVFVDKGIIVSPAATKAASLPHVMSPNHQDRLNLLPRIGSFKAKGWINAMEEREYLNLLEHTDYAHNHDVVVRQVVKSLEFIEKREKKARGSLLDDGGNDDEDERSDNDTERGGGNEVSNGSRSSQAREHELSMQKDVNGLKEISQCLRNRLQIEDLFVEMCFFARLGFLQPPSCLHCAYRAGVTTKPTINDCSRLVVWRKDANIPHHPDSLERNSIVVTCRTARAFMRGASVSSLKWDRKTRCLLSE